MVEWGTEGHGTMIDVPRRVGDDQKAAVRALIDRLQPGDMLKMGEQAVARYFYDRVIPGKTPGQDKYLERISPDYEVMHEIQMMIVDMVKAGELAETGYRWHWTKPQPNRAMIPLRKDQPREAVGVRSLDTPSSGGILGR